MELLEPDSPSSAPPPPTSPAPVFSLYWSMKLFNLRLNCLCASVVVMEVKNKNKKQHTRTHACTHTHTHTHTHTPQTHTHTRTHAHHTHTFNHYPCTDDFQNISTNLASCIEVGVNCVGVGSANLLQTYIKRLEIHSGSSL